MTAIFARIGDVFGWIWTRILEEPVFTQGLIVAGIATGTAFGLNWNGAQVGAVTALSAGLLTFLTRRAVTSVQNPSLPSGTAVTITSSGIADSVRTL